jgi:DNA-binding MarR family transcriptional regulator
MKKSPQSVQEALPHMRFASEVHKALINLWYTYSHFQSIQLALFRPFDLTPQQFNILVILRWNNGEALSILEIKQRVIDPMSNVSRLVEKLRQKGLVDRQEDLEDRRMVRVGITKQGEEMVERIFPVMSHLKARMLHMTTEEATELNRLLDKLRKGVVEHGGPFLQEMLKETEGE